MRPSTIAAIRATLEAAGVIFGEDATEGSSVCRQEPALLGAS